MLKILPLNQGDAYYYTSNEVTNASIATCFTKKKKSFYKKKKNYFPSFHTLGGDIL